MNEATSVWAGRYDYTLVALSVLIAIAASHAALGLASRTSVARGVTRLVWLIGGAVAMGFGIWSMHYVGMLAFKLPVPVRYDLPTVVVSLLAAMFASGVALFVVSRPQVKLLYAAIGSLFMGAGIVAMHYIGMAAMRLPGMCRYNPALLNLSIAIAVVGSFAALWLTFHHRTPGSTRTSWKILSAVAMGFAIAAMHYTGMAAATFYPSRERPDYSHAVNVTSLGVVGIVAVTFLLLGFAVFTSIVDQRLTSHRKLAEDLFQSKKMLQSVLDNIPQRVFWKDMNHCYLGCNRAFATDVGLSDPEQVVGKTDTELFGSKQSVASSADLQTAIEKQVAVLGSEQEVTRETGQKRWLRTNFIPLQDSTGRLFGILGTYDDITERRRAEEAVRRSNAALSDFAQIVSHDLQSPLRVAKNYVQLLVRTYAPRLDDTGRQLFGFLEESILHMDNLVRSLLNYATATESEAYSYECVALNSLLERALANLEPIIAEAGAQITSDALPTVTGYPAQILQILQNLISNAIKYRKKATAPRIHVSARDQENDWLVSVRDNGIGIAPENVERIFAPLKRLHGRDIPGFGIGLATCKKVVSHHGGQIWVESELGAGSTFYFTLPKKQPQEQESATAGPSLDVEVNASSNAAGGRS